MRAHPNRRDSCLQSSLSFDMAPTLTCLGSSGWLLSNPTAPSSRCPMILCLRFLPAVCSEIRVGFCSGSHDFKGLGCSLAMQAWNIGDLLPPFSIAYIKGWRRTVAAFICCQAIRDLELWGEISAELKAGVNVHLSPKPYKARKECLPAVLGKTSQILK